MGNFETLQVINVNCESSIRFTCEFLYSMNWLLAFRRINGVCQFIFMCEYLIFRQLTFHLCP